MIDNKLLDELITKANIKSDKKIIERLKDDSFIKSLNEVTEVLESLGYSLNDNTSSNQKDTYLKISSALVRNFFTVYYVNLETGAYVGYSSNSDYKTLKIEENGNDFFKDVIKNTATSIYIDDQDKISKAINKRNLIESTKNGNIFKMTYRIMLNNIPTYVALTAIRLTNNDLIIGLSNIDDSTKKELEYHNTLEENLTYTNIALALCRNYFAVYYVNMETDDYEQYNVDSKTQVIEKIEEGKDFFYVSTINAKKYIYKEDLDKFLFTIDKENLTNALNTSGSIRMIYRQLIDGISTYVSLKVLSLANDSKHIVFAVSNIDEQKRKENEYYQKYEKERLFARTDCLTGCYNRNYFIEVEEDVNHKIENKSIKEFATVICDINDLKTVNDTMGHDIGDKFIIEAKNIIIDTFKDSLTFRVGGDEFITLLSGKDYKNRVELIKKINEINIKNKKENKVIVACGYSDFDINTDSTLGDVLKRADVLMYENKKRLKQ